jgi:hypothetical protein
MSDIQANAGVDAEAIHWPPLHGSIRAKKIAVIMDRDIQRGGFIHLRRGASVEGRLVIKIRSFRIASSVQIIRAYKESNRSGKLPGEVGIDVKVGEMNLLPPANHEPGHLGPHRVERRRMETAKDVLAALEIRMRWWTIWLRPLEVESSHNRGTMIIEKSARWIVIGIHRNLGNNGIRDNR